MCSRCSNWKYWDNLRTIGSHREKHIIHLLQIAVSRGANYNLALIVIDKDELTKLMSRVDAAPVYAAAAGAIAVRATMLARRSRSGIRFLL